jgi:hypothetical protein
MHPKDMAWEIADQLVSKAKKKICVFPVDRPTLKFYRRPYHFLCQKKIDRKNPETFGPNKKICVYCFRLHGLQN